MYYQVLDVERNGLFLLFCICIARFTLFYIVSNPDPGYYTKQRKMKATVSQHLKQCLCFRTSMHLTSSSNKIIGPLTANTSPMLF